MTLHTQHRVGMRIIKNFCVILKDLNNYNFVMYRLFLVFWDLQFAHDGDP